MTRALDVSDRQWRKILIALWSCITITILIIRFLRTQAEPTNRIDQDNYYCGDGLWASSGPIVKTGLPPEWFAHPDAISNYHVVRFVDSMVRIGQGGRFLVALGDQLWGSLNKNNAGVLEVNSLPATNVIRRLFLGSHCTTGDGQDDVAVFTNLGTWGDGSLATADLGLPTVVFEPNTSRLRLQYASIDLNGCRMRDSILPVAAELGAELGAGSQPGVAQLSTFFSRMPPLKNKQLRLLWIGPGASALDVLTECHGLLKPRTAVLVWFGENSSQLEEVGAYMSTLDFKRSALRTFGEFQLTGMLAIFHHKSNMCVL